MQMKRIDITAPARALPHMPKIRLVHDWFDRTVLDLGRQMRWSYLPPLMVYFAAGVSGLTSIVGTFFVKEQLGLSAAFLAGLAFWTGIPWALKMPLGHLVDLIWRWKALMVWLGAALIAASIAVMYLLITHQAAMAAILDIEAWYVISTILAPVGYVLQDVVADAMTVEAVPVRDEQGRPRPEAEVKTMHTTMQTLGRIAIIGGTLAVALVNVVVFSGIDAMSAADKIAAYADIYALAMIIPLLSVIGVMLAALVRSRRARALRRAGVPAMEIARVLDAHLDPVHPDWRILGGGLAFVAFTLGLGLARVPADQEIIFVGSMAIVIYLMHRLLQELSSEQRRALVGTAIIIFVFRATPSAGAGVSWWQIDVLGFDQQFLSVLTFITAALTLVGMLVLRPMMANHSNAWIIVLLSIAAGILALPIIGLYYGLHHWTAALTGGIVDARFIAMLDTAIESPLGQVAMIPMLAWIARNAPLQHKATFFAVMASFTNLALAASSLGTRYLNQIFVVHREVRVNDVVTVPADYSSLGWLLIATTLITVLVPILVTFLIQRSPLRTMQ